MATQYHASEKDLRDYWQQFVNRRAYTIQSATPHAETGKHYYYRPRTRDGRSLELDIEVVRHHLEGILTIGLYAMNPETQRCKWIAADGDYDGSVKHLCELQGELEVLKVESALEQSRRGAHLWIFGQEPLAARECRILIAGVARRLKIPVKGSGTAEGIEIFPKHDEIREGEFGNAIRGPMGIHRANRIRYWFYGADYSFALQLAYLRRLKPLSQEYLTTLIGKLGLRPEEPEKKQAPVPAGGFVSYEHGPYARFSIRDYVETARKTGRNWVTRCPSCALEGRDRGGDNLAISIAEPQKYICWAGCTKEMIRAALGRPIPAQRGVYAAR